MTAVAPPETPDLILCAAVRAGRAAADALVRRHKPMVIDAVSKMNLPSCVDRDELIQEGMIALSHAALKFDPSTGNKFSTYAFVCVSNAVRRTAGREADKATSLNAHPVQHEGTEYLDMLPAPERPEPPPYVRERVAKLPELLRRVVALHFGLDGAAMTAGEIARSVGVTVPQAKRALEMALARL